MDYLGTSAVEYNRKAEAEAILAADESRLGETFRADRKGLSPAEQAEKAGTQHHNFVYNNRVIISALVDGDVPNAPSLALAAARRLRTLLKRDDLSPELRTDWVTLEEQLSLRAEDSTAAKVEDAKMAKASVDAESAKIPGIYVYTLPHYLRYPVDPSTGKTYLKVGHSSQDVIYRMQTHSRFTGIPEDPVLLRIYPVDASAAAEKAFHEWLRAADHDGARGSTAGKEWFLTSTRFLDKVASSLNLERQVINPFDVDVE